MAEKNLSTALKNSPTVIGNMGTAKDLMSKMMPAIMQAIPRHLNGDRMSRIILTEFHKNPKLLACSQASIIGAVLQSVQLGLEIGSGLGQAYMIPFEKRQNINGTWAVVSSEAQFIVGYQGMIELANRSGNMLNVYAGAVRKGDHFVYKRSLEGDVLEHEEKFETEEITHFYALARFKNGGHAYLVWPMKKMKDHAIKNSKVRGKLVGPWESEFEAMGCKTMIRSLFKFMPKSAEMAEAVHVDGSIINKVDTGLEADESPLMMSMDAEYEPEPSESIPTENNG